MNKIALIILFTIILDFILNGIADYLNLKALRSDLPQPFQGRNKKKPWTQGSLRQPWAKSRNPFGVVACEFGKTSQRK